MDANNLTELKAKAEKDKIAQVYYDKYETLKNKINTILWDKDFYKAIHSDNIEICNNPEIKNIEPAQNVKELIGYIPWCFNLAPNGFEKAFFQLKDTNGFQTKYGLTTAEQRHSRYLFETNHECLWNGYN